MSLARSLGAAQLAFCGLALAGLAACASTPPPGHAGGPALTPTEKFAVQVKETPDQIALAVHADGISPRQQAALADFVGQWRDAGAGVVTVSAPADSAEADKAKTMTYAVQTQLQGMGVPANRIELASYTSGGGHAPVLASFHRMTAQGPDCSGGWDNLTSTMGNEPYSHFGCAIVANIAAQVADPHDFVSPPGLAPGDNARRQVVLSKYRDGKITASDKDDQANGAVSSAVKP